jgi:pyrroline-5-carboxylate reductase
MKRLAVAAMLVLGPLVLVAETASAEPPAGSAATCPPRYQAMTLEALLAQAERNGISEDQARNLFDSVNKNQDAWICQTKLPGDATDINFIDNQAVGRDRS